MGYFVVCILCIVFIAHSLALRSAWNCATPIARALQRQHLAPLAMAADSGASIKERLAADMKEAMKSKEKIRLGAIRSVQVAIKQKEVDDRVEVTDELAISIMSKLIKQRKESIKSYQDGGRTDLAENEQTECDVIASYMPQQLSPQELQDIISSTIMKVGATSVKDMSKVMSELRPLLAGRADLSALGSAIRDQLGGGGKKTS